MLSTGKHDVRGAARPRAAKDPALGLRLRLPASARRTELVGDRIELHLFDGGYAGIVLQEGGTANICLALRKSALAAEGSDPGALFEHLARRSSALAERLGDGWQDVRIETIGAVPYGYIAETSHPRIFRIGDQAAVIPSLAGEGISIALHSGVAAACDILSGGFDPANGRDFAEVFARRVRPTIEAANIARNLAEQPLASKAALLAARLAPGLIRRLSERTRMPSISGLARLPAAP